MPDYFVSYVEGSHRLTNVLSLIFTREGNYPGDCKEITYGQLLEQVCKFANVLKAKGGYKVKKYLVILVLV